MRDGQLFLHGVPYNYGYPYYPMMFLAFLPFRLLGEGVHSIRIGNFVFLLLNVLCFHGLARRLLPRRYASLAGWGATVVLLSPSILSHEAFQSAVTDFVIPTFALFAYLALASGRAGLAGVLFGLAQACKLLPGPFLIAPALLWLFGRPGFWRLFLGYVAASLVVIGPFFVVGPGLFISSTFLFYVVNHGQGDATSLWFYVPEQYRRLFSIAGYGLSTLLLLNALRMRRSDVTAPMTISFVSYFCFMAFAPMIHTNYFCAIYAVGCIAITLRTLQGMSTAEPVPAH